MRRASRSSSPGGGATSRRPSRSNDALIESGIATLERATAMDRAGQLEEAFTLYENGIDLMLKGAREEATEQRRQTLLREVSLHMSRAEILKAAITPPAPSAPSAPPPAAKPAAGKTVTTRGGRGRARGKAGLSRPRPTEADVRGSLRGGARGRKPRAPGRRAESFEAPDDTGMCSDGGAEADLASPRASGRGVRRQNSENTELERKILEDMLDGSPGVSWDSIAGLSYAKQTLQEAVILPSLRPDLFTGLRAPAKGVLLYGPPGTGKTMLAKAVATESGYAFFNISASSLTSKYVGEGEKMVRALFSTARRRQPAVIFVDEIDSVLSARSEGEHEASRRLKTEFLVQLDGVGKGQESDSRGARNRAGVNSEERLLVLAATNLPQELDEAVLRRLSRRVYVPLPDAEARKALLTQLLSRHKATVKGASLTTLVGMTDGYSGSDLKELCKEAAMQPIRELGSKVRTVAAKDVRGITLDDFRVALPHVRPSVSKATVDRYDVWEKSLSGL